MNQNGFSVVELKVCCAIIAICTTVSVPYVNGIRKNSSLNREIRTLHNNLQYAKIEAIKQNAYVVFKVLNEGYSIFVDDGACGGKKGDWKIQGCEKQLARHKYHDGIFFDESSFTAQRTRFNGRVCMKAGSITLRNSSGRKSRLVVDTVGRIRVE